MEKFLVQGTSHHNGQLPVLSFSIHSALVDTGDQQCRLPSQNKRVIIKEPSINAEGHTNYFIFKYLLEGQVGFGQHIWIDATKLRFYKAKKRVVIADTSGCDNGTMTQI